MLQVRLLLVMGLHGGGEGGAYLSDVVIVNMAMLMSGD